MNQGPVLTIEEFRQHLQRRTPRTLELTARVLEDFVEERLTLPTCRGLCALMYAELQDCRDAQQAYCIIDDFRATIETPDQLVKLYIGGKHGRTPERVLFAKLLANELRMHLKSVDREEAAWTAP